ncbi:isoprenyl transferase [Woodsholea maritima]|uniref:isoprenyl transferase n=1 Tax=Woodsholea maritima TaxID=240237 RepID=UPI0003684DC4|nr:isoprenyl transferase [Woodsholea maritima]
MTTPDSQGQTPQHIAIIMDGNGRWAKQKGRPRAFGHKAGVDAVRRAVRACGNAGVRYLTLFGFSTENWRRPAEEIEALFELLRRFVDADLEKLHKEGVRVRILGSREGLSPDLISIIERAEVRTRENSAFFLNVAFNYGGRDELVRAAKAIAKAAKSGDLDPDQINEELYSSFLDTSDLPDPDILLRTSGEYRISNFLLWQCAYSEFIFLDNVMWPDFDETHLQMALEIYASRDRRYGGVKRA